MTKQDSAKKHTEPLVHITKRSNVSAKRSILIRAAAVVSSFIIMSLLMFLLTKENPITLITSMFNGTF